MSLIPAPHLQTEDRLLLALLRGDVPDQAVPATPETWERLLRRARMQRVEPHLLAVLRRLPRGMMPEPTRRLVTRLRRAWSLRSFHQDRISRSILHTLAAADLPVLVLKGPAMAGVAYADPQVRADVADLDLLVPADRHQDALEAVHQLGYRLRNPALSRRYHRPFHMHDVLMGPERHVLELHWALSRPDDLFRLDAEEFFAHGAERPDTPGTLWTSPTDLLLHTACQGLGEGFSHLQRIIDADGLLRRQADNIDWQRLQASAARGAFAPALWLLVQLAAELLHTPSPPVALSPPGRLTRGALRTLEPAAGLASTFAARHSSLRQLYDFWLATGTWNRVRAAVRMVRRQTMQVARQSPHLGRRARLAAILHRPVTFAKLLAYQTLCVMRWPWRRRHAARLHFKPSPASGRPSLDP